MAKYTSTVKDYACPKCKGCYRVGVERGENSKYLGIGQYMDSEHPDPECTTIDIDILLQSGSTSRKNCDGKWDPNGTKTPYQFFGNALISDDRDVWKAIPDMDGKY